MSPRQVVDARLMVELNRQMHGRRDRRRAYEHELELRLAEVAAAYGELSGAHSVDRGVWRQQREEALERWRGPLGLEGSP